MESDHKVIGRELGLFSFDENVPGVVYWWPKGITLFNMILDDLRSHLAADGYKEIRTSVIISNETLKKSGHFENYHDKLFFIGNEKELKSPKWCLKPMSCPGSLIIFNEEIRSYKDLPIKLAEFGSVFRYEQAGEVNGLLRLRNFTQDDAHIYCDGDQIKTEIIKLIDFVFATYKRYGFEEIRVELSTRPKKSIGSDEQWSRAEEDLKSALSESKIEFKINEGDGAFYGPKIDFHIKDSIERSWQLGTIQLDFAMSERLNANYVDAEGQKQHPVMIHRAILGSVERFIAILLEHHAGVFPAWLAPVQVKILSIAERHMEYAKEIKEKLALSRVEGLKVKNVRVEVDERNESIGKKIREAELAKIPYMLIIGDKEVEAKKVAVRKYGEGDKGQMDVEELVGEIIK